MTKLLILVTGPAKEIGMVPLIRSALIKARYTVETVLDGPYLTECICDFGIPTDELKRLAPFIVTPADVTIFEVEKVGLSYADARKNIRVVCDRMSVENGLYLLNDEPISYIPEVEYNAASLAMTLRHCDKGVFND